MPQQPTNEFGHVGPLDASFIRVLVATILYSFSGVMFLFSMAFFKDVRKLREIPTIVWGFICGVPNPDGPGLPILLTLSTLALLGGLVVTFWHLYCRWRARHATQP